MTENQLYSRTKITIFGASSPEEAKKAVHNCNSILKEKGASDQQRNNIWGTIFEEDIPVYESEDLISTEVANGIREAIHEIADEDGVT
jgi:hypothetical protein